MMYNWRPTERLDTILDRSIDRLDTEDPEDILRDYPQSRSALAPMLQVADALRDLGDLSMRPAAKQAGRDRLRRAVLARSRRKPRPVAANALRMAAWVAAFVLICGGTLSGLTLASADALPNQPLYAWKRASETVWLNTQTSTEREIAVSLVLADRRVNEMTALYQQSGQVSNQIVRELKVDYTRTLQLIDTLPAAQAQALLKQTQATGAEHEQALTKLAQQANGTEQQLLFSAVQVSQWVQRTPPGQITAPPAAPTENIAAPRPERSATSTATSVPTTTSAPVRPPATEQPPTSQPTVPPSAPPAVLPPASPTAVPQPPVKQPSAVPQPAKKPTAAPQPPVKQPSAVPQPAKKPTAAPQPTAVPQPPKKPTAAPQPTVQPTAVIVPDPPSNPTALPAPSDPPGNGQPGPPINPPGNPTVQPGPPLDPPGNGRPTDPPKEEKPPKPTKEPKDPPGKKK